MPTAPLIEIYLHGKWTPAASIEPLGDEHARVEYLPEYIFATDRPVPISLNMPVELTPIQNDGSKPLMPAFLYDLVPQGKGRKLPAPLAYKAPPRNCCFRLTRKADSIPTWPCRMIRPVHTGYSRAHVATPGTIN